MTTFLLILAVLAVLACVRSMADLTQSSPRSGQGAPVVEVEWPMSANSQLWAGAALMLDLATGLAVNCAPTAGGKFIGFAKENKDNRTGSPFGGTAFSTTIKTEQKGRLFLPVSATTTWSFQEAGDTVYASDGNTFTKAAGTNNIPIGKVAFVPQAAIGQALAEIAVDYEAASLRSL